MRVLISLLLISITAFALEIQVGAAQTFAYLPLLKDKNVALVVNQSSEVHGEHLVDLLQKEGIKIQKIFAPEHGFRGNKDAGEHIKNGKDPLSGIPIISLYGKHKKPTQKDLKGIDIILFDIQDVGVRFYTYLSTLHYVMEAAAQNHIPMIVLDRPNPNGARIDGEILNYKYQSFVGIHPVPILYGMTIGEYALMINGEHWLKGDLKTDLTVIPLRNYRHNKPYYLPINPSPNLPNELSIYLYPSLALFEGTSFSVGVVPTCSFRSMEIHTIKKEPLASNPTPKRVPSTPNIKGRPAMGLTYAQAILTLMMDSTSRI